MDVKMLEEIEERLALYQTTVMCTSLATLICLVIVVLSDWGLSYLALSAPTPIGKAAMASLHKWGFATVLLACLFVFVGLVRHGWQRDMLRLYGGAKPLQ
jgi:hypothetical protein